MTGLSAFLAGLVFGIGLIVSGMTDPSKIIGFLDLAGRWDPSLAFVMAGAVAVAAGAFKAASRRSSSLLNVPMRLPVTKPVDRRLLLGSAAFGVGWGIAGFCPGPALVDAAAGMPQAWLFVAAMLAGMALYRVIERPKNSDLQRRPST